MKPTKADREATRVKVAGRTCLRTLAGFKRATQILIAGEQVKANPDTNLIGILCDAVRLARENEDMMAPERERARREREVRKQMQRALWYLSGGVGTLRESLEAGEALDAEEEGGT